MRAAEFMRALADIIEKLDGEDSGESHPKNPEEKDPNPVMVPPLQLTHELDKAEAAFQDILKSEPAEVVDLLDHKLKEHYLRMLIRTQLREGKLR